MANELVSTLRPAERAGHNLGRFQIVAPLGQGGMGTIHLALAAGPADFRKLLVVKELRQDLSANQRFVQMFLDEAKLAARLNHPNVVQTMEVGQQGDRYYLSMEFLDGQPYSTIWQTAKDAPQLSLPIRLEILCDALAGLHYAHTLTEYDGTSLHIVHRDVSPQNIFVTYDGQVKVVDFGIAKAAVSSSFSTPGVFKGKFGYAAPEQVRGDAVDARTDVFAMGVILWETLTMQRFSDGVVNQASVAERLAGKEPRVSQLRTKLDPQLCAICDRALAVEPAARFASADELRAALDGYLQKSGQRVERAAISRALLEQFAAERKTVHRLIDRHIKHGPSDKSRVSAVTLGTEAGNNQPTQVADLSKYIHTTTDQTVVSDARLQVVADSPRRPRGRRALGATAAVLALGAGLAAWRLSSTDSSKAPAGRAAAQTASAEPRAPRPAQPTAAPRALPADEARPSDAAQPTGSADDGRAQAQEAQAPVERAVLPAVPDAPVERPSAKSRRSVRARLAAAAVPAPASASPLPPPATAVPVPEITAPAPKPAVAAGIDLKGVEKSYQRRNIDTDL